MSTEAPLSRNNPLDAVHCFSKTDIGQKREENQDSFGAAVSDAFKFYFVCDGMGGVKGGAVASQLAVSVIEEACSTYIKLDEDSIRAAVAQANSSIFDRGTNDEQLSGMGTTFVGLAFVGPRMLVTSVGDSRAYRVRDGEITQLTEDHTLVRELLRSGSITEEQAVNHPVSHMLTRSLGPSPEIEIDCWQTVDAPLPGDTYMLCSDGLYNMLGLEELGEVILSLPPEESVQELVSLANLRGGHDNITVMLVALDHSYPVTEVPQIHPIRLDDAGSDTLGLPDDAGSRQADEDTMHPAGDAGSNQTLNRSSNKASEGGFTFKGQASASHLGRADQPRLRPSVRLDTVANISSRTAAGVDQVNFSRVLRQPSSTVSAGSGEGDLAPATDKLRAQPRSQARFLVILLAGLAGAYLLGHLHGTDEIPQLALQSQQSISERVANPDVASDEVKPRVSIAVAPIAIQPVPESAVIERVSARSSDSSADDVSQAVDRLPNVGALELQSEDRRKELQRAVTDIEQKLAAFRAPISGKAGEMLKVSTAQIEGISKELDVARGKIDSSTRALTIWLGRKKRLQSGDPINLSSEVAISSDVVKTKQDVFNQVTYTFLQENEVLRFNPGDKTRERKVADLARQRLAAMRDLIDSTKQAIQDELSQVERQIEASALMRVELEGQLEQARRDVEYVKALAGSDTQAREAKQLELQRLLDLARAELEEIDRSVP